MKVITEERLRYVLKMHFGSDDVNQSICSHLINELQELDTLTVSKLRPMCEAPRDGSVVELCAIDTHDKNDYIPVYARWDIDSWYDIESISDTYTDGMFMGFLPKVIYKPEPTEEIIWPNACG